MPQKSGLAEPPANSWLPQVAQNSRHTVLPLSAGVACRLGVPRLKRDCGALNGQHDGKAAAAVALTIATVTLDSRQGRH